MGELPRVGVLIPNLFVRVPVDSAVRSLGGEPVPLARVADARVTGCPLVLADADAVTDEEIRSLCQAGCAVVVFGPHREGERLTAARRAGAVALPRSLFLARLPEILASALAAPGGGGKGGAAL